MQNIIFDVVYYQQMCENCLEHITTLRIENCRITNPVIAQNFDILKYFFLTEANATLQITTLWIQNVVLENFKFPIHPVDLNFVKTQFRNLQPDFLVPHRDNLYFLYMQYVPEHLNMDMMFGAFGEWRLAAVTLQSNHNQMRTIAASNFTGLKYLIDFELSRSQVDTIMDGAFDSIVNSLKGLDLRYNNFKVFPYQAITGLIDQLLGNNLIFHFNFDDNPFECTCEMMDLWDIVELNQLLSIRIFVKMPCRGMRSRLKCQPSQTIHYTDRCFPSMPAHSYSNFNIRMNKQQDQIVIASPGYRKYRLFVHDFIDEEVSVSNRGYLLKRWCPSTDFARRHVKCLTLHDANETVPLSYFGEIEGVNRMICINYVIAGPRRFWPLHCISQRFRLDEGKPPMQPFSNLKIKWLLVAVGSTVMFLAGLILTFIY